MTLSRKIAAALDENTRAYNLPCTITVDEGPNRITLDITALDAVGVAFDTLEFAATDRTDWSSSALNAWGDQLAKRVTYLMEPLRVLEIDAGGGEVQIRSAAPTPRADARGFYEVRLNRGGTCRLERYVYDESDRKRRRTPCHLTREVVERLADDIAASAV
ncbi:MAG: hypothetical protein P4L85_22480 [Paludisphaera borealis]|uniref:hypothetical protein n=1 Tax=Paludisphaera borealis TaxID=1387353 RepID=UPI00284DE3AE|nr:hypothetical protein [Paludisphaera borealis]MDR3622134.1 hypothetical protein [Paludisphaera borealis]